MPISTDMTPKREKRDWRIIPLILAFLLFGGVIFYADTIQRKQRETYIQTVCGELPGRDYAGCKQRVIDTREWSR